MGKATRNRTIRAAAHIVAEEVNRPELAHYIARRMRRGRRLPIHPGRRPAARYRIWELWGWQKRQMKLDRKRQPLPRINEVHTRGILTQYTKQLRRFALIRRWLRRWLRRPSR